MLIAFILIFGLAVTVNAFISLKSGIQSLVLASFLLVADYGASLTIQFYSYPPDRQVWLCLLNFGILFAFISNYKLFVNNHFLKTFIPLGYMVMTALNVLVLASRGATWAVSTCEFVSDVIFLVLLGVNLVAGLRYALSDMGSSARNRRHDIRVHHTDSVGRRK